MDDLAMFAFVDFFKKDQKQKARPDSFIHTYTPIRLLTMWVLGSIVLDHDEICLWPAAAQPWDAQSDDEEEIAPTAKRSREG